MTCSNRKLIHDDVKIASKHELQMTVLRDVVLERT